MNGYAKWEWRLLTTALCSPLELSGWSWPRPLGEQPSSPSRSWRTGVDALAGCDWPEVVKLLLDRADLLSQPPLFDQGTRLTPVPKLIGMSEPHES